MQSVIGIGDKPFLVAGKSADGGKLGPDSGIRIRNITHNSPHISDATYAPLSNLWTTIIGLQSADMLEDRLAQHI
jgi:hypothetical protein